MIGQTISHYRIVAELGSGGMGVVYKAEDLRLQRPVALKFLSPGVTRDAEATERLVHEARAASALDHPNICVIHEIDEAPDGRMFVAMGFYEGQTLRQRIAQGPIDQDEALRIATDVTRAVGAAHEAGIVHRDIKPANIIVTKRGEVKLLDFGIAKLAGQTRVTRTGTTVGTLAYMAPEYIGGAEADEQSDVWSIGVVLYEMLAGRLPFRGEHDVAVMNAILHWKPASLNEESAGPGADTACVVARAIEPDRSRRYASANALLADLDALRSKRASPTTAVGQAVDARPVSSRRIVVPAVGALIVAALLGFWWVSGEVSERRTRDAAVLEVSQLVEQDAYVAAYAALRRAEGVLGDDPALAALWSDVSVARTIRSDPPGVDVSVTDVAQSGGWQPIGRTPLEDTRVPRGIVRWRFERAGVEPLEFISEPFLAPETLGLSVEEPVPGMQRIPAGDLSLVLAGYNYNLGIPAAEYFIDKREVTNREFKEFVDAGGYVKRQFWKHDFVEGSRRLSWEDAMARFQDRTGRRGPATWDVGAYPLRQDDYPVDGVSWYEAAAYAEFRGRSLPSIYHWVSAAGTGVAAHITPFSNFRRDGSRPVTGLAGIGPLGLVDMAGNVREWCLNEIAPDGNRYILGGAWNDPEYMFTWADARSPFDRSAGNGFRLAEYPTPESLPAATLATVPRLARDYSDIRAVSDEVFDVYRSLYAYDAAPLDARIEAVEESSEIWRRERVSFTAAGGKDRVIAYLFLPKSHEPPYQAIVYWPGSGVIRPGSSDALPTQSFDFLVMSGRDRLPDLYGNARAVRRTSVVVARHDTRLSRLGHDAGERGTTRGRLPGEPRRH